MTVGPGGSTLPTDPRVEAALATLATDNELADQLLLLGWNGDTPESVVSTLERLHPAGIVYVGSNAETAEEATQINVQIEAEAASLGMLRPFIAIDLEGGRVQRITDVPNLGSNLAFGADQPSNQEACQRGAEHAAQLAAMGFTMNLAPDVDVLTNPNNTVIGDRSYGSDPELVARLGAWYVRGLQGGGIAGVAKHFPGHGNTTVDSHTGLPTVPYGLKRLEQVELVPFERVIQPDVAVSAVMIGHLAMTKLDPSGTPASLSRPVVDGLLRDRLGFDGLVMTDDLGAMAAVTAGYTAAEATVMALNAGVDLLLVVGGVRDHVPYRDAIVDALASGALSRDRVMEAVRHVLEVKARFGLLGGDPAPTQGC